MVRGQLPLDASPTKVTVTMPQLSVAVTELVAALGTSASHWTVTADGHVTTGGVVSLTVIACVHVVELPQVSVARYVRVMVRGHEPDDTSPTNVTVTAPQLSVAVTDDVAAVGTSASHCTVTAEGHVTAGGVVSFTVMVCVQVVELPHGSVAR